MTLTWLIVRSTKSPDGSKRNDENPFRKAKLPFLKAVRELTDAVQKNYGLFHINEEETEVRLMKYEGGDADILIIVAEGTPTQIRAIQANPFIMKRS
ncbi:hypothetical protein KGO95_00395 [Patescibacteria group bacterium]|nr:hypothetical protein [Patescibacteria group bacterium]